MVAALATFIGGCDQEDYWPRSLWSLSSGHHANKKHKIDIWTPPQRFRLGVLFIDVKLVHLI